MAYTNNARTHSRTLIQKIAKSIKAFGFINPILVDGSQTIIAGHGRLDATKLLKLERIPVIRVETLTADQVRAYILADNVIASEAGWDEQLLRVELDHLTFHSDIDISLTSFEIPQIDLILGGTVAEDLDDELPALDAAVTTKSTDVWLLGKHRIVCGDARDSTTFATLMRDRVAAAAFIDPPYNVVIDGHATGNGKTHHAEFQMASGEMSGKEFTDFLMAAIGQLAKWTADGSVHYICMDGGI